MPRDSSWRATSGRLKNVRIVWRFAGGDIFSAWSVVIVSARTTSVGTNTSDKANRLQRHFVPHFMRPPGPQGSKPGGNLETAQGRDYSKPAMGPADRAQL